MKKTIALAFLILASTLPLCAQQNFATIVGVVRDVSGAVVPDVAITAIGQADNVRRETRSDGSGNYSLPFLKPGSYSISAASSGFQTQQAAITLDTQQTARLDFTLKVGDVSERVTVEASAAALQTENATVGTVIDSGKITDLPLNDRNFVQLAQLVPGVQGATPGSMAARSARGSIGQSDQSYGSTNMSANGNRDTFNRFYLDGIEFSVGQVYYPFSPSVDSLSEFKVETSTYSAEMGGAPGAHVNLTTRRGDNRFTGAVWEFNRNNDLTQTYDAVAGKGVTSPRLNRNQYGARIGGPLLVPKLYNGKDKTFFFFNWESGKMAQGAPARYAIVPTDAARNGDFRGLVNARTGQPITLKDPLNIGIVNNIIPKQFLSKPSQVLLGFTPMPNTTAGNYNFLAGAPSVIPWQNNYLGRIDHSLTTNDALFFRIVIDDRLSTGIPFWGHDEYSPGQTSRHLVGSWIHTFSPRVVNEFRGGLNSLEAFQKMGSSFDPAYDVANKMGIPMASKDPRTFGPPTASISGPDGDYSVFSMVRNIGPQDGSEDNFEYVDTLSWQRGSHFLKFGGDVTYRIETLDHANSPRGVFSFDGLYTGSALADFMLGYVRTGSINPNPSKHELRTWWHSYFVNDDWKVTPRLSLTLGVRYDYFRPWTEVNNKILDIELNGFLPTRQVDPTNATCGRAVQCGDHKNFSPRLGFAYRPSFSDDAVIRGGYGIYYIPITTSELDNLPIAYNSTTSASVTGSLSGIPDIMFANPFTGAGVASNRVSNFAVDQNMKSQMVQQWNLTVQKKLPGSFLLDVGYVGSKGSRLIATVGDVNRPIDVVDPRTPGLPSINARRPNQAFLRPITGEKTVGMSNYHSLQVKLERRIGGGVTLLHAYTYSKAIDSPTDMGGLYGVGVLPGGIQDMYNFANEKALAAFDVTQRSVTTVLYDLPFFKGSRGLTRTLLGGWQVSTIALFQSGFPATIGANRDTTGTGVLSRPDFVSGQAANLPGGQRTWNRWFNTNAFTFAPYGRFGNMTRNAIRAPGMTNFDFAANKFFAITERTRFEFRTEFYNIFNNYNPDSYAVDRSITSVNFGKIGGGVTGITTRVIQLGAKLYF
ncbi:MAG: TonB-dependent receptor [Bryobacterales bacterium]|nr:TonB-dependent receptor [Bryobacterales bacterium]